MNAANITSPDRSRPPSPLPSPPADDFFARDAAVAGGGRGDATSRFCEVSVNVTVASSLFAPPALSRGSPGLASQAHTSGALPPAESHRRGTTVTRIVCQVSDRPGRITLVWSAGRAAFEPVHIEGGELSELRNVAAAVRQRLAEGHEAGDLGGRLFSCLFPGPLGAEIAGWPARRREGTRRARVARGLRRMPPAKIPWTVVDDPQRPGPWGRRLAISGGHRVHPLRSYPDLVEPKLLAVVSPGLDIALADPTLLAGGSRPGKRSWSARARGTAGPAPFSSSPTLLWIIAPASDGGWRLDTAELSRRRSRPRLRRATSRAIRIRSSSAPPSTARTWPRSARRRSPGS